MINKIIETLADFFIPYNFLYKYKPDQYMLDELNRFALHRNNYDDTITIDPDILEKIVTIIFNEVKNEYVRKHWFEKSNTLIYNFQRGVCKRNFAKYIH